MPLIEITEKNKNQYGGKCVVLQSHIHDKHEVKPGEVVTKIGMDYFEALKCKLVRNYDPALDEDDPVQDQVQEEESKKPLELKPELEPKKLGPKKRTKKVKE